MGKNGILCCCLLMIVFACLVGSGRTEVYAVDGAYSVFGLPYSETVGFCVYFSPYYNNVTSDFIDMSNVTDKKITEFKMNKEGKRIIKKVEVKKHRIDFVPKKYGTAKFKITVKGGTVYRCTVNIVD